MAKFIQFIVWSSANPNKISASIKGLGAMIASMLVLFNLPVDVNSVTDQVVIIVNLLVMLASSVYAMYGMIRKAYLTIIGENQVLD